MTVAHNNALPASESTELERAQPVIERLDEILDRLGTLEYSGGIDMPDQIARELGKLDDTLNWRIMYSFEERMSRLESALARIAARLEGGAK